MSDMIPVEKVAAAALHQVRQAAGCFPQTYHDTDKVAKAKVHLQVAEELLGLIAPPPFASGGAVSGSDSLVGDAGHYQTVSRTTTLSVTKPVGAPDHVQV